MAPLLPLDHDDDWSAEIYEEIAEYFDGEILVKMPDSAGTYDPVADTFTGGTPGEVLIDWRPGRAQHLGQPLGTHDGNGWATRRRFLFQCENRSTDPLVPKGAIVRFRGGKDHTLDLIAFQVASAVGSSSAALRTIRADTEGVRAA